MKKFILILASLVALALFVGCTDNSTDPDASVPIPTSQSILESLTGDSIEAVLVSATLDTITVEDGDGNTYIFPSSGVPVDSNYGSLAPGATILVYYHGTLDPALEDTQPVETERFIVTSGKAIGEMGSHIGKIGQSEDSSSMANSASTTE